MFVQDGSPVTYSYYGGIDVDSVINTPEQIRAFCELYHNIAACLSLLI